MTKKLSGQVTVTTAGTAVQETGAPNGRYFLIRALAGNSGVVYVGNDGAGDFDRVDGWPRGNHMTRRRRGRRMTRWTCFLTVSQAAG